MKKLCVLVCLVLVIFSLPVAVYSESGTGKIIFDLSIYKVLFFLEKNLSYEDTLAVVERSGEPPVSMIVEDYRGEGNVLIKANILLVYDDCTAIELVFIHPDATHLPDNVYMIGTKRYTSLNYDEETNESKEQKKKFILDACSILIDPWEGDKWNGCYVLPIEMDKMREYRELSESHLSIIGTSLIDWLNEIEQWWTLEKYPGVGQKNRKWETFSFSC